MQQIINQTYQSKWGHHAMDYDGFLKLKEAHALLLRAYRDCKRYIRWNEKLEHNRCGSKPLAPYNLVEVGHHVLDKRSFYGLGFKRYKGRNLYLHVLAEYRAVRRPAATPEDVVAVDLPDGLEKIIAELREFYCIT